MATSSRNSLHRRLTHELGPVGEPVLEKKPDYKYRRGDDRRLRVVVEALGEIEGHPWADWKGGKLITRNALAHLLEPFGIRSGSIRLGDNRVLRGYQLSHFQDAFERYLP